MFAPRLPPAHEARRAGAARTGFATVFNLRGTVDQPGRGRAPAHRCEPTDLRGADRRALANDGLPAPGRPRRGRARRDFHDRPHPRSSRSSPVTATLRHYKALARGLRSGASTPRRLARGGDARENADTDPSSSGGRPDRRRHRRSQCRSGHANAERRPASRKATGGAGGESIAIRGGMKPSLDALSTHRAHSATGSQA